MADLIQKQFKLVFGKLHHRCHTGILPEYHLLLLTTIFRKSLYHLTGHLISILYIRTGLGKLFLGFQIPLISDYLEVTKTRLILLTTLVII